MRHRAASASDLVELTLAEIDQVSGGYLSPDQELSGFPVIALPRIDLARSIGGVIKQVARVAAPIAG